MGVTHSVAQGIADKIQITVTKAFISEVPDLAEEQLQGVIDGTLTVTNKNILAVAPIQSSRVYLEMTGSGSPSDIFAHFQLPKLSVKVGTASRAFSSNFTITNKTTYLMWLAAMTSNGGVDLNLHAKPVVSSYSVNVDKHNECAPLAQLTEARRASSEQEHYGQPPCLADEFELWSGPPNAQTVICVAGCDGSASNCPAVSPARMTPRFGLSCNESTPSFPHGLCMYHCFTDADCGGAAVCQVEGDSRLGLCTFTTNVTRTTTTTTTTTTHMMDVVAMTCDFVGNAPHVEPDEQVIV